MMFVSRRSAGGQVVVYLKGVASHGVGSWGEQLAVSATGPGCTQLLSPLTSGMIDTVKGAAGLAAQSCQLLQLGVAS